MRPPGCPLRLTRESGIVLRFPARAKQRERWPWLYRLRFRARECQRLRKDLALSPPGQRAQILAQFAGLKTRADARKYLDHVRAKIQKQP